MMSSPNKKRKRTIITDEQFSILENAFRNDVWPNRTTKNALARQLGKSESFVSIWFQNRRSRWKKEEKIKEHWSTLPGNNDSKTTELSSPQFLAKVYDICDSPSQASVSSASTVIDYTPGSVSLSSSSSQANSDDDNMSGTESNAEGDSIKEDTRLNAKKKPQGQVTSEVTAPQDTARSFKPICIKYTAKSKYESDSSTSTNVVTMVASADNNEKTSKFTMGTSKPLIIKYKGVDNQPRLSNQPSKYAVVINQNQPGRMGKALVPLRSKCGQSKVKTTKTIFPPIGGQQATSFRTAEEARVRSREQPTLFRTILTMLCIAEGGILPPQHRDFPAAVNDYLYGIRINDTSRIIYNQLTGLEVVPLL